MLLQLGRTAMILIYKVHIFKIINQLLMLGSCLHIVLRQYTGEASGL